MRVFCPIVAGSGVEIFHHRLRQGLTRLGVTTEISSFSPLWEYFPWGLSKAVRPPQMPGGVCDVLHTNVDYGSLLRIKGIPFVVTLHHSTVDEDYLEALPWAVRCHHRWLLKPFVIKTLGLADQLAADSCYSRDSFCEMIQQDLPIPVIYSGVDTNCFKPQSKSDDTCGPIVLFFSGNWSFRKGADLLEPVMKQLGQDFLLQYTSGLRQARAAPITGPNIRFLGRLSEIELVQAINESDIALQPSRREGFGLSILEAMACGKPVVSTLSSAIPEVVQNGKGGLLCEPNSISELVTAVRKLAQSKTLREDMGNYNRQAVLERFNLDQMATQYFQLYSKSISEFSARLSR